MKVKYFHDTCTALIEFSANPVAETKEINENLYVDLDSKGNPVAITIEHADLYQINGICSARSPCLAMPTLSENFKSS